MGTYEVPTSFPPLKPTIAPSSKNFQKNRKKTHKKFKIYQDILSQRAKKCPGNDMFFLQHSVGARCFFVVDRKKKLFFASLFFIPFFNQGHTLQTVVP